MSRANGRPHATLYDFRDLDLMLKIRDEFVDGACEAGDLAEALGFDEARPVGSRLAWMRRYGMVDFDERHRLWTVTKGGERVIAARLRAAQARTIADLPDEAMIEVMANISSRYHLGSPLIAQMLRREFLYGTARR